MKPSFPLVFLKLHKNFIFVHFHRGVQYASMLAVLITRRNRWSLKPNPQITLSGKFPAAVDCRATGGAKRHRGAQRGIEGHGGAKGEGQ